MDESYQDTAEKVNNSAGETQKSVADEALWHLHHALSAWLRREIELNKNSVQNAQILLDFVEKVCHGGFEVVKQKGFPQSPFLNLTYVDSNNISDKKLDNPSPSMGAGMGEWGKGAGKGGGRKRGHRLDENWQPCETSRELCGKLGLDLEHEVANFKDYWLAASGTHASKLDWDRAFNVWLRRAASFSRPAKRVRGVAGDQDGDLEIIRKAADYARRFGRPED